MARLIDADEALRMMQNSKTDNPFKKTFAACAWDLAHDSNISCVEACPTVDAVEVVRCKDCEYKVCDNKFTGMDGKLYHRIKCCRHGFPLWHTPDDFCSYGERRTDNA